MIWFWVVVLVVLIGAIAIVASGRGDSMAEVYEDRPDASVPAGRPLNSQDLRAVRLNTGVRGYRMDEVDALLARIEADLLERENREFLRHDDGTGAASSGPRVESGPTESGPTETDPTETDPNASGPTEADPTGSDSGSAEIESTPGQPIQGVPTAAVPTEGEAGAGRAP